ncbi:MAG TPA: EamA family transporter [Solirubrobacteraceae bacterium]|jgi:inner membrane transporter RhtA
MLLIAGALSQYAGAGVAVLLFHSVTPSSLAWLRSLLAAAVLCAWRRPWQTRWTRERLATAAAFGVVLCLTNVTFYLAIARIDLGTAVAIEFVGPVAVAAISSRRRRDLFGLLLLVAGVGLLSGVNLSGSAAGVAWALVAGIGWSLYIVLGHRLARARELRPQDGLAAGLAAGGIILAPFFAWRIGPVFSSIDLFGRAALVAVASNVVPYSLEQLAMRRLARGRFAVMLALLPVSATVMGLVVLGQTPSVGDAIGIALVIGAIWLTADRGAPQGGSPRSELPIPPEAIAG